MRQRFLYITIFACVLNSLYAFTRTELPNIIILHQNEDAQTLGQIDQMLGHTKDIAESYFEKSINKRTLYIYKDQKEFQRQKHPIVSTFLKLDWYIGDNIGEKSLIVSPNTKLKVHTYQSIINAIPHEYIHTVVYSINKKCPLWISEGLALYLSNRYNASIGKIKIPPIGILKSNNSLYFEKHNGYFYADKFIEYIELYNGRSKVIELVKTGDYEKVLGTTVNEIYSSCKLYTSKISINSA